MRTTKLRLLPLLFAVLPLPAQIISGSVQFNGYPLPPGLPNSCSINCVVVGGGVSWCYGAAACNHSAVRYRHERTQHRKFHRLVRGSLRHLRYLKR